MPMARDQSRPLRQLPARERPARGNEDQGEGAHHPRLIVATASARAASRSKPICVGQARRPRMRKKSGYVWASSRCADSRARPARRPAHRAPPATTGRCRRNTVARRTAHDQDARPSADWRPSARKPPSRRAGAGHRAAAPARRAANRRLPVPAGPPQQCRRGPAASRRPGRAGAGCRNVGIGQRRQPLVAQAQIAAEQGSSTASPGRSERG